MLLKFYNKRYFLHLLFIIFIGILSGCATGIKQSAPDASLYIKQTTIATMSKKEMEKELKSLHIITINPYLISTGDRFVYKVYGYPELAIPGIVVLPGGKISVGLAGVVKVGGLTVTDANEVLNKRLSKFIKNPRATLIPTYIKGATFTIIGKVGKTGVFPLKSGYNIADGIAVAGGLAVGEQDNDTIEMADLEHTYISRGAKVLPVNFIAAVRNGDPLHNIPLQDGDFIFVPSAADRQIYLFGEVNLPGQISYGENQTLARALSVGKGRILSTASDDIFVIRGNLFTPRVFEINSEEILQGRAPDFALQANDIVYVPKSGMTEFNDVLSKFLPTLKLINLMAGPFGATDLVIPVTPFGGGATSSPSQ